VARDGAAVWRLVLGLADVALAAEKIVIGGMYQ